MSAQVVEAFPIDKSANPWKDELFEYLNERLDQIAEQSGVVITEIGRIVTKDAGIYTIDQHRIKRQLHPKGWDHFKSD